MIEEIQTEDSYLICGLDEAQRGKVLQPEKPEIVVAAFSYDFQDGVVQKFRAKRDREGALEWMNQGGEYLFALLINEKYKHAHCNLGYEAPKLIRKFIDSKELEKTHLGVHFDGEPCPGYDEELISYFSFIPRERIQAKNYTKTPDEDIYRHQPRIVRLADGIAYHLSQFSLEELLNHPNLAYACD